MNKLIFLSLIALSGCAELTTKTFQPRRSGTVMYEKSLFFTDKNREKAMELAREHCSPNRVLIMAEDNRREFNGTSYTNGSTNGSNYSGITTASSSSNTYIHFTCPRANARKPGSESFEDNPEEAAPSAQ
jgi:hypothetical protein